MLQFRYFVKVVQVLNQLSYYQKPREIISRFLCFRALIYLTRIHLLHLIIPSATNNASDLPIFI